MTADRFSSLLASAVLVFLLLGGLLFARPTWLGGDTSNLIVSGQSMDGTYRTGDLVLVKRASSYRVGQIIGFDVPARQPGAGMVVIHRIVAVDDHGRYVTKGDNNPERDPWTVGASDVRGSAYMRVPIAGQVGSYLRGPIGIAGIFGGLAAWVAFGFLTPKYVPKHAMVKPSILRVAQTRLRLAGTSRRAS